jgi:hypothetical protein
MFVGYSNVDLLHLITCVPHISQLHKAYHIYNSLVSDHFGLFDMLYCILLLRSIVLLIYKVILFFKKQLNGHITKKQSSSKTNSFNASPSDPSKNDRKKKHWWRAILLSFFKFFAMTLFLFPIFILIMGLTEHQPSSSRWDLMDAVRRQEEKDVD